jgi:hypothetical protein
MSDFELDDRRQQMQTLKNMLEKQQIVNDTMMRRSMKKEVSSITRRYYGIAALGVLMIPYGYWAFVKLAGFSMAFWSATCIFMLICSAATYYNSRNVSSPRLMEDNLVEVRTKMARAKKFDSDWLLIGIPMVLLWLGWFVYELYKQDHDLLNNPGLWGGCIGAIIGTIGGVCTHLKTQRQYQDIIDQIEDLTADTPISFQDRTC